MRFDNGKIRRELGLQFRPVETTVVDTVRDLERWGHLTAR
jgi:dihydroflavonol-4-reductase